MIERVVRSVRERGTRQTASSGVRAFRREVSAHFGSIFLRHMNRTSKDSLTGNCNAIVSLTTYGSRVRTVYLTIESIGRGTRRPRRIILWLDANLHGTSLPLELQRQVSRGLEVCYTDDLGPHKKYYPALDIAIGQRVERLITADDDVMYPAWWLERMMEAASMSPDSIVAYRTRRVALSTSHFAPWSTWPLSKSVEPSVLTFGIGEAGVGYPQPVLRALKERGTSFLLLAPRADDIWLHSTAVSVGVPTRQVHSTPLHPLVVPGSQTAALAHSNIDGGGNDRVLNQCYDPSSFARLKAAYMEEKIVCQLHDRKER